MPTATETLTLQALSLDRPGVLSAITEVIFRHGANINEISTMRAQPGRSATYLEVSGDFDRAHLLRDLQGHRALADRARRPDDERLGTWDRRLRASDRSSGEQLETVAGHNRVAPPQRARHVSSGCRRAAADICR